ncbi:hypothetical protein R6Q59_031739 [Mikania micrantha]
MNAGFSNFPDPSKSGGSQTDPILLDLLKRSSTPLHYREYERSSFVFWSKNEGSENNSSSDNWLNTIQDKIKYVFSNISDPDELCIGEFWAPVTINERRVLSTSGQPFYIYGLTMEMVKYRLHSEKHQYDIDVNKLQIEDEGDPNIRSGGPATTFLRRLANADHLPESESCFGLNFRIMLPICFPSDQSDCIGVLGFTFLQPESVRMWSVNVSESLEALKNVGLDFCEVQQHMPYEAINGLRHAKDNITCALAIVCKSHNLGLCQAWGAFEDKRNVHVSSYLEDTRKTLVLKLTCYLHNVCDDHYLHIFKMYNRVCNKFPLERAIVNEDYCLKTFQDLKPRYLSILSNWEYHKVLCCAFAICLRSFETGDFNFVFVFIWPKYTEDSRCDVFLEAILSTVKRCLPSFKFASGAEIGDELDVIDVEASKEGQNTSFKIFQGKQPIVVDSIAPSKVICETTSTVLHPKDMGNQLDVTCVTNPTHKTNANQKTAKKYLTREVIEKQFGKAQNEAAINLKVSLSTLKRNCKDIGILEWPGPNLLKRKANDSYTIQISTNEANVTTQDILTVNENKNIVFIKADYADDMIKFELPVLQATFATVEERIGVNFKLSVGTFKLKYLDEVEDWILLTSDEEMKYCLHSSRKADQIVVRLRVLPSQQLGTNHLSFW